MNRFSDRGSTPLDSTSPEGRAAKHRGSSDKIVSSSHDGEFGFGAFASTSPEGRAAKHRSSSDKIVSSSHDGEFGFGAFASTKRVLDEHLLL